MPSPTKTTKASTSAMENVQEESSTHEESPGFDQEQDPKVFFQPPKAQVVTNMFLPYTEGPKMDWTVNDGLYHIFLKWHLKCYQKEGNARRLLLGAVILAWTSMFHGGCPVKS